MVFAVLQNDAMEAHFYGGGLDDDSTSMLLFEPGTVSVLAADVQACIW